MKYSIIRIIVLTVLIASALNSRPGFAEKSKKPKSGSDQLLTRIDFGNSYISGQTLKSGAVYLLQRKKSETKTMLKYREKYRKEILEAHELYTPGNKRESN